MVEISGEVKEWDAVEGMRNDFHQLSHVYRSSSAHFIRPKIRRVSTMTTSAHTHVIPVGRHGPHSRTRTFPSRFDQLALIREFVGKVVADVPLDNARAFDLKVAVSEASANAIEHGLGEGDLEVSAKRGCGRITVTVSHPGAFRPLTSDDSARAHRGMGLPLILALTNELTVSCPNGGGTSVSLSMFTD